MILVIVWQGLCAMALKKALENPPDPFLWTGNICCESRERLRTRVQEWLRCKLRILSHHECHWLSTGFTAKERQSEKKKRKCAAKRWRGAWRRGSVISDAFTSLVTSPLRKAEKEVSQFLVSVFSALRDRWKFQLPLESYSCPRKPSEPPWKPIYLLWSRYVWDYGPWQHFSGVVFINIMAPRHTNLATLSQKPGAFQEVVLWAGW